MKLERLFLAINWFGRKESLTEFATRISQFLLKISETDFLLAKWYEQGESKSDALSSPIDFRSLPAIESLLLKNRGHYGRESSFNVTFGIWNGLDHEEGAALTVNTDLSGQESGFWSCVILKFPLVARFTESLINNDVGDRLLHFAVEYLDPYGAVISSDKLRRGIYQTNLPIIQAGWLTYISDLVGALPPLPNEYEVKRIEGMGSIITIKSIDRVTMLGATYVGVARHLSELLAQSNLLRPTPPAVK